MSEDAPKGYAERFIHSEIYKKYKGVNSVVHGHPEVVLPYSISSIPLRPVFHMSGVMGKSANLHPVTIADRLRRAMSHIRYFPALQDFRQPAINACDQ